jgi:hypothetical protein
MKLSGLSFVGTPPPVQGSTPYSNATLFMAFVSSIAVVFESLSHSVLPNTLKNIMARTIKIITAIAVSNACEIATNKTPK